jgi:aminoglycoside phosphotransferase (APT) family kinase protein
LDRLVITADAFCHHDLHRSNWILSRGEDPSGGERPVVVGFLDWAAAGYGDPESDLASLLIAGGMRERDIEPVCAAWEETYPAGYPARCSARRADRARVVFYMALQLAERAERCGPEEEEELTERIHRLASLWDCLPPVQATVRTGRLLPKPETKEARARWVDVAAEEEKVRPLVCALQRKNVLGGTAAGVDSISLFGRHACNDVCRVRLRLPDGGGRTLVAKIYNKPVTQSLFALEELLAERLKGGPAAVFAPEPLAGGGTIFRVGGRVAALYPDGGDELIDDSISHLRRLAEAQASLHSATAAMAAATAAMTAETAAMTAETATTSRPDDDLLTSIGRARNADDRLELEDALQKGFSYLESEEEKDALREAARWLEESLEGGGSADLPSADLPKALVHGSLHRDHVSVTRTEKGDEVMALFDFEKARWSHRIEDITLTAYYMGYRTTNERIAPGRLVAYLQAYHRCSALPLTSDEQRLACPYILRWFFHDLRILPDEGKPPAEMRRHARALLDLHWNREALTAAVHHALRCDDTTERDRS